MILSQRVDSIPDNQLMLIELDEDERAVAEGTDRPPTIKIKTGSNTNPAADDTSTFGLIIIDDDSSHDTQQLAHNNASFSASIISKELWRFGISTFEAYCDSNLQQNM